jgi:adenine-specific DNA methylase
MESPENIPRAIEKGFPIVEINRLAVPERNAFKPVYQMHKWFARRASCVFRAILLGALKPAIKPDGTPTDLMEEFYLDHTNDPDTLGKTILDPFMGGGTTVVEALRLGCRVVGIDLNPVAWFIVKTEVEPVDLDQLRSAFKRLAGRPVDWNQGKPLRETLLDLYKTEVKPDIHADVIYTFWVKHAVCTDPTCRKEVPLFKDYIIAQKSPSVRYSPDVTCPNCKKNFDWELEAATLIAEPAMMVSAPRGSAGEGRPTQAWAYAPHPEEGLPARVICPHCSVTGQPKRKIKRPIKKRVPLTVLLCPECEAVWQWRGALPDERLRCPACGHTYDPRKGNVPDKGKFVCRCGQKDAIIESIRSLTDEQRLPVRPYAVQAYLDPDLYRTVEGLNVQTSLFEDLGRSSQLSAQQREGLKELLLPKNGKFFRRFSGADVAMLKKAEAVWDEVKGGLPYPRSRIPVGEKTKSGLIAHHYNHWHEMFFPRQLLALATLLKEIMAEADDKVREMLLCAFSGGLEWNNQFCRYMAVRNSAGGQTVQGVFARHDFQPKQTITENNAFGIPGIAMGSFESKFRLLQEGIEYSHQCWDFKEDLSEGKRSKVVVDKLRYSDTSLNCHSSAELPSHEEPFVCVTDPPYVGNVNYSELSDFFYVWLRLALKDRYPHFAPEYTPKVEEIVENKTRGKTRENFYEDLSASFSRIKGSLPDDGLLVFTFHHTDQEGMVWEGLLRALCDTGFEIAAVYPVHGESESSLHLMDKENISYDLIHVCRKRTSSPEARSWAGIRQNVRKQAREELAAIEAGRYGGEPLNPNDVRLICIGKCLELYSRHYGKVVDHEGKPYQLHEALQDIRIIVDQLVARERPLPAELEEDIDAISYVWFRVLLDVKAEINVNDLTKALRGVQVSVEDLKKAGLVIKGRTGRGRYFKVKQPQERLNFLKEAMEPALAPEREQMVLFDEMYRPVIRAVRLVDLVHLLIGLAWAGESVAPWLERYSDLRPKLRAALHYVRDHRKDWREYTDRVLSLIEGMPLFQSAGDAVPVPDTVKKG